MDGWTLRAVVLSTDRWIRPEHLSSAIGEQARDSVETLIPGSTLAEIERVAILKSLEAVGGSTARAASMLGISQRKIQYRLREYGTDGFPLRPRITDSLD